MLDERLGHGVTGDHEVGDLLLFDDPPDLIGLELCGEHDLRPDEALTHEAPLRGAVHQWSDGEVGEDEVAAALGDHLAGVRDAGVGNRIEASAEGEEDVVVAPDHALGHARRASGIDHVVVVA